MGKLLKWWKAHPGVKTAIVGTVGTAAGLAAQGMFGPKAAAIAAGGAALYGLFVKRPQDSKAEHDEAEELAQLEADLFENHPSPTDRDVK